MGHQPIPRRGVTICLIRTVGITASLIGLAAISTGSQGEEPPGPRSGAVTPSYPFPLELAFSCRSSSVNSEKATISPAGRHLAYGVVTPNKQRYDVSTLPSGLPVWMLGDRLHLTELSTSKMVALGAEGTNSFSPAWSPDGTKLAYYSDEGGTLRAWIFDVAKAKAALAADVRVKVHVYTATPMPPTWSPDGRELLIPTLPADEANADPRPPFGMPRAKQGRKESWSGVLVMTSGAEPAPPAATEIETFTHYGAVVDITAINIQDGKTRIVLPAKSPGRAGPAFARYSPSGRYLAYVSHFRPGPTAQAADEADLGVLKVGESEPFYIEKTAGHYNGYESYSGDHLGRSGVILAWHPTQDILLFVNAGRLRRFDCTGRAEPRPITLAAELGALNGSYLAFTPDGRAALVGIPPANAVADDVRLSGLALAPLDGGPARKLPLPEGFTSGRLIRQGGVSLWQPVANTATFLQGSRDGSQTLIRRLDLVKGEWTTVRSEPGTIEYHGAARDGSFLIGTLQSYAKPPDFYRLSADFAPQDRLTTIEPRLDGRDLGLVETFHTTVPLYDGKLKSVRTAVLLPPGAKQGDRLPAIVTCYGGDNKSQLIRAYGGGSVSSIPTPVFTSRGFAVVLTDAPLGPEGQPGQPVEELRDLVLPQVYRAAELSYIDIERVALTGNSYGGYCTAALISSTNLFRAAVAVSGSYDLASKYGRLRPGDNFPVEWAESGQGRMGQSPWSDFRRYLDNSPYYRADRIRTPLLMIHGRDDTGCPVQEAETMFTALKRLGRTAQLAVYEGEGHAIDEWDSKNAIDATERMLDFLKRHLDKPTDR